MKTPRRLGWRLDVVKLDSAGIGCPDSDPDSYEVEDSALCRFSCCVAVFDTTGIVDGVGAVLPK
jgi:hypothetical protein